MVEYNQINLGAIALSLIAIAWGVYLFVKNKTDALSHGHKGELSLPSIRKKSLCFFYKTNLMIISLTILESALLD